MTGRRLRGVVFAVGVLSLVATVAALLFGSRYAEPRSHEPDSFSASAIGQRALVETLEALGVHVVRFRTGSYDEVRAPLWFIEPDPDSAQVGATRHDLAGIVAEREKQGRATVVVLGKWLPGARGFVRAVPDRAITDVLDAVAPGAGLELVGSGDDAHPVSITGSLGPLQIEAPRLQVLDPDPAIEALESTANGVVVARVAGTHVLIVSDPDLFHNFNVQRDDNAELALRIVQRGLRSDTVVFDEVFHGHGSVPSLAGALGRFPAVLLPIHALLLALLVAVAGAARFGPVVPPPPPLRAGPAEAVAIGGSVLAAGQPAALLVIGFVEHAIDDIAQRWDVRETDVRARAHRIDEIATRRGVAPRACALLDEVAKLHGHRSAFTRALAIASATWTFKRQVVSRARTPSRRKAA